MEFVQLSETLTISRIVHGMMRLNSWNLSSQEKLSLIKRDLELGITTFDHADIYGNYRCEKAFGEVLALEPQLREKIQLVTKCGIKLISDQFPERTIKHYDTSKKHIIASVNQSLENLNTDYIDLLLIHRPDPFVDPAEVSEAFDYLYQSGKVLNFGVSNFTPSSFNLLQKYVKLPLVTNQIEISPMNLTNFDNGTIELCQEYEIPPMAWSPLAGGSIFSSSDDKAIRLCQTLEEISKKHGFKSLDEVIYAWLLNHPAQIIPIVGSGKQERLQNAVKSLSIQLTREEWYAVYVAALGHNVA